MISAVLDAGTVRMAQHFASELNASRADVDAIAEKRLTALVQHAFTNVPYYRPLLLGAGVLRSDGRIDISEFGRIPLLTKDDIRAHGPDLLSQVSSWGQWRVNYSGGSTGQPVRLLQDARFWRVVRATKYVFDWWTGFHIGDRKALLWGSERDLSARSAWQTTLIRGAKNELWLNAFRMGSEDVEVFLRRLSAFKPVQILAYAQALGHVSTYILSEGLDAPQPTAIMSSASALTEEIRQSALDAFHAPVFDRYGSREVGDVACECAAHNGLHVCSSTQYVEMVTPQGAPLAHGELGEVCVTPLWNYAMPLLRYRIGDVAEWKPRTICACGRSLPTLARVRGRVSDMFLIRSGKRIHGEYFTHLMYGVAGVQAFRFIQKEYSRVVVELVLKSGERLAPALQRQIQRGVWAAMGEDTSVEFVISDHIDSTPSGKYRYTISEVQ